MRFLLIRAVLSVLPNGSRLSCGASAGGRKRPALRYELVGAQAYGSFESRPRQLQALVRPPGENGVEHESLRYCSLRVSP